MFVRLWDINSTEYPDPVRAYVAYELSILGFYRCRSIINTCIGKNTNDYFPLAIFLGGTIQTP